MNAMTATAAQLHPETTRPSATATDASRRSRKSIWLGRTLSGIPVAFLLMDAGMKLAAPPFVVEGTTKLGYPAHVIVPLGVVLLACVAVHVVPRTAVLGAVLVTGYLGGAIATHVRVGDPLLSHVLFPIYVAALLWGGLWLRDERLRAVLGKRRPPAA